jgi:hypothetical protein
VLNLDESERKLTALDESERKLTACNVIDLNLLSQIMINISKSDYDPHILDYKGFLFVCNREALRCI